MKQSPICTILAGPNGSGKSSLFHALQPDGAFINADLIARVLSPLNPESASLAAGRQTIASLGKLISEHASFAYETTLGSHQSVALMMKCKRTGYRVELVFVMLENVELNLRRIQERVANGGHDIPEAVVRRRHVSAFRRLPSALQLADAAVIIDNSGLEPRVLATIESGKLTEANFDQSLALHRSLAQVVWNCASTPSRNT